MATQTPNLNLTTYNIDTEGNELFITAWENLIGTLSTSNMNKIDGFAGSANATLQLLQSRPGANHAVATSSDGLNYVTTISGLLSLSTGMIIYLQPNMANTGNPYLNINGLGGKPMYKTDEIGENIGLEVGDLIPNRRILMVYDGFSWHAVGGLNLNDYRIDGAIGSLLEISATNGAIASSVIVSGGKILGSSVAHDSTISEDEFSQLTLSESGITPGTYKGTTYDVYGRATASSGKVQATDINHSARLTETSGILDLSTTGITAGTYKGTTYDVYGRATASLGKVQATDINHSTRLTEASGILDLATSGIVAGTYKGTTFDAYGRATGSSGKVSGTDISISGIVDRFVTIGRNGVIQDSGIATSALSGLQSLSDPDVDRLLYWNDASGQLDWYVEDGWSKLSNSGNYVSSASFRIGGDVRSFLRVGTKLKFTNGTTKYAYVTGTSYSSPNTTVTIIGSSVLNTTVSNIFYSYADSPYGFPSSFSWTPSTTGWSGTPATAFEYTISSGILFFQAYISGSGLGSGTATTFTVPIGCKNVTNLHYGGTLGYTQDSEITSTPGKWTLPPGGSIVTLYKDSAMTVFSVTSGTKAIRVQGFYHI